MIRRPRRNFRPEFRLEVAELPPPPLWQDSCHPLKFNQLGRIRGILEMVQSMSKITTEARFIMGGTFSEASFERVVKSDLGWNHTQHLGWLDRSEVKKVLADSVAGLVTLHPVTNYLDALPVKMFEYMAAGVPVIASDFTLWRQNKWGVMVRKRFKRSIIGVSKS